MKNTSVTHVQRVLLAAPRGWCAGVARAVEMVEQELTGKASVYMRHPIVHNDRVVRDLAALGARVVEDLDDVPVGATVIMSAHGVPPQAFEQSDARNLTVVDATCPLVSKVHAEVRRFAAHGFTILVVGHRGHVEVIGTMGQAPDATLLVTSVAEVDAAEVPDPAKVAWVSQTTLSVTDAQHIVAAIRRRFPDVQEPRHEDICYATTNRQAAVVAIAAQSDIVLVIGSTSSSNSMRMVERARECGVRAELVENAAAIASMDLTGIETVGLSSGASASQALIDEALEWFRSVHGCDIEEVTVAEEEITFAVPAARAAGSGSGDH